MTQNWSNIPMVTCPHCGEEFQLDDYYNLSCGDTFDCNKCEKEIHILEMVTVVEVCLGTEAK